MEQTERTDGYLRVCLRSFYECFDIDKDYEYLTIVFVVYEGLQTFEREKMPDTQNMEYLTSLENFLCATDKTDNQIMKNDSRKDTIEPPLTNSSPSGYK